MNVTRKQFSMSILIGLATMLFGRFIRLFTDSSSVPPTRHTALYWKRTDTLAG